MTFYSGLFFLLSVACASGSPPAGSPEGPREDSTAAPAAPEQTEQNAVPSEPAPTVRAEDPLRDGRQPDPKRALPRLSFRHLGMHIGGESNTEAAKRPWFDDIESERDAILRCYRWVERPGDRGSFGLDLYVGRAGGRAEVRAMRQKLGGDALLDCMAAAFSKIEFHPPERPTVLSYSLFFEFDQQLAH